MTPAPTYYHGGPAGLKPGDYILPPNQTGAKQVQVETAKATRLPVMARPDRVYVTTDATAALMYAALRPFVGHVYLVQPEGVLVADPDCTQPGLSWECERAQVLDVIVPTRQQVRMVDRAFGIHRRKRTKRKK